MARRIVIMGAGPGGYEAALVAASAGADVTVVEAHGIGGAAVLTDAVPSKTLIATAEWRTIADRSPELGIRAADGGRSNEFTEHVVDLGAVNDRVDSLVVKQSADIAARLEAHQVRLVTAQGRLVDSSTVRAGDEVIEADAVLIATGASPRVIDTARPDGIRILSWTQLYGLRELPEHLIVVGSGVTGAEFAGAYRLLGSQVTLISSRPRVLANQDAEAAAVVQEAFAARGMSVLLGVRAAGAQVVGDSVEVTLTDGSVIFGSHCLIAAGSVPNTQDVGLEAAGVAVDGAGAIVVDRVSRTSAAGVYAAGDCTGVLPLASVAAAQGRIAMAHALGDSVQPLDLMRVAQTVFTAPEIASVGASEDDLRQMGVAFQVSRLDLAHNPRAKMLGIDTGFVKVFANAVSGQVLGAVIVGSRASEHIYPLSVAVANRLTVDEVAGAFTVYPSLSGTTAEVARRLHRGPGY